MQSSKGNLQDLFLNQARKEKMPVTVFLMKGFQIKGQLRIGEISRLREIKVEILRCKAAHRNEVKAVVSFHRSDLDELQPASGDEFVCKLIPESHANGAFSVHGQVWNI